MERTVRFGYFCSVSIPCGPCCIKQISQSQSIRTLAYLFYAIGLWDGSPRNRKSRLTANHWDDRRNSSPLILVEMAKAVSERNEVECSFDSGKRIYRANNIRAKQPETARCWTGMCYFVKNVMKFLRELCLCIRQSLRFLCSIWRITHSYKFYSNCA